MSKFTVILLIAIFSLIVLFVWNGINFRSLKKSSRLRNSQLNDAKYWELKYKYEFLIAIVGLITAAAGFLGYNSLQSIEIAVKNDFNKKVDSIKLTFQDNYTDVNNRMLAAKDSVKELNRKVKTSQFQLQQNAAILYLLRKQQFNLREAGYQSKDALKNLSIQIDSINKKNKIKKEFYLVTNVALKGLLDPTTIKFSLLKTNSGDRLPIFKKPPIVIPAWGKQVEFRVTSTTTEEFQIQVIDYSGLNLDQSAKTTYYGSFIIYEVD